MSVPPWLMVEQALYHQCNDGTNTVPPLVMGMQSGSTNNHISQIFFVLAAPNVMVVLVSSTSTNSAVIRRIVMLAAPILIDRSMTNYCPGVSGNGNRINPRWRPNKKRNGHPSPGSRTNIYNLPASLPPLFLIGHYL